MGIMIGVLLLRHGRSRMELGWDGMGLGGKVWMVCGCAYSTLSLNVVNNLIGGVDEDLLMMMIVSRLAWEIGLNLS